MRSRLRFAVHVFWPACLTFQLGRELCRKAPFVKLSKTLLILAGCLVLLALIRWNRSNSPPPLTVAFLGYSNSASGLKFGIFTITNCASKQMRMEGQCWFQTHGNSNSWNCIILEGRPVGSMDISPLYSETLAIPVDKNMGRWRLGVRISPNAAQRVLSRWVATRWISDFALIESPWIGMPDEITEQNASANDD